MPAIFSLPLGGVAPRKPSTELGTIINPAVERVAPRRNWRRVNWAWVIFIFFFIEFRRRASGSVLTFFANTDSKKVRTDHDRFMPECPSPHGRPRPSGGNGGPGTDRRVVRDPRRGGAGS